MNPGRKLCACLASCLAGLVLFGSQALAAGSAMVEPAEAIRAWRNADVNGLPGDSVTAIIQTHDGFLWVGTTEGLVRFDGVKFTPIKLSLSTTNLLFP